jgi:hypothetical protein
MTSYRVRAWATAILGISHQRVHLLFAEDTTSHRRAG